MPFVVREGGDEIAVEGPALAQGLVVVPRERSGVASDLGDDAPAGIAPDAPVRMIVEHASTVEHAAVLGVPRREADGRLVIGPGLGRPLILTTLEQDEAMRVLTGGAAGRARLAVIALAAGVVLLLLALLWGLVDALFAGAATVLAASPEPTLRPGSDTRTTGGGFRNIGVICDGVDHFGFVHECPLADVRTKKPARTRSRARAGHRPLPACARFSA